MSCRPRRAIRFALLALALGATAAALARADSAPAAKSKSEWQVFEGVKFSGDHLFFTLGWSSNRLWAAVETFASRSSALTLGSARMSRGSLTGFTTSRVPTDERQLIPMLDGELAFGTSRGYVTAPLLASGRLGATKPLTDDLPARVAERLRGLEVSRIEDGARVRDRVVWALSASRDGDVGKTYVLACCSADGAASDVILRKAAYQLFLRLGVDTRGRLWLAWLDTTGYAAARGVPRLVELDPSTLEVRGKVLGAPMLADKVQLACAAACRLVAQTAAGDIVSWAPAERAPTRVVKRVVVGSYPAPALLLDVSYRGKNLVVAYHGLPSKRPDPGVFQTVQIARGDARGAGARVTGTVGFPNGWPLGRRAGTETFQGGEVLPGTFVPGGFVALSTFSVTYSGKGVPPIIAAFVPHGR